MLPKAGDRLAKVIMVVVRTMMTGSRLRKLSEALRTTSIFGAARRTAK
jgi:hypothetical protein